MFSYRVLNETVVEVEFNIVEFDEEDYPLVGSEQRENSFV